MGYPDASLFVVDPSIDPGAWRGHDGPCGCSGSADQQHVGRNFWPGANNRRCNSADPGRSGCRWLQCCGSGRTERAWAAAEWLAWAFIRTTVPDTAAPRRLDRANRQFKADRPNQLWVSDFTYVSTWQGWQYVAFVVDVYARRIVGWRVSSSMRTDFVLDELEQALHDRQTDHNALIHHSDRGSQYVSILYTERLAQAGIEPSVGSRGDSYDNALAETINGLYKTELIHRRVPGKRRSHWNWPPWNGCPGSTTTDCCSPLGIFHRPRLRQTTIGNSPRRPRKLINFNQLASTKPRGDSEMKKHKAYCDEIAFQHLDTYTR